MKAGELLRSGKQFMGFDEQKLFPTFTRHQTMSDGHEYLSAR